MAGCGSSGNGNSNESFVTIPEDTNPCKHFEYWPQNLPSTKMISDASGDLIPRLRVYYRNNKEREMALKVIGLLDDAWDKEMNTIGFTAPLLYPSEGTSSCGQYASFAVFLWDGHRSCFVTPVDPAAKDSMIPSDFLTPWGGLASYMILDAWGPYGIDRDNLIAPKNQLPQTVGHELNHASHAADDFHDIGIAYEMSATFIEQLYGPTDPNLVAAFQSWPEWSLLWFDDYVTWYMYGSALYLHFLRDKYFYKAGRDDLENDQFLADLWRAVRNTPDPTVNSPNWVDGINTILAPNSSFIESAEVFARWRYYAGSRDDGKHFRHWSVDWDKDIPCPVDKPCWIEMPFQPEAALNIPTIVLADTASEFAGPMVLGNVYVEIERAEEGQTSFELTMPSPPTPDQNTYPGLSLRWMVQALPGIVPGSDGETVSDGKTVASKARVAFAPNGKRTLVFTLLPVSGFDPEKQWGERYKLIIKLSP